ncbi:MAG: prolipoprotein diacylglyceryl transferase, partial [Acidimicrobiales bacterium]
MLTSFGPLGSIPSPSTNVLHLGPLDVRLYGLLIAIAAMVGTTIADRRWAARGGQQGEFFSIALWAVPAGVIGARLYHVATDWKTYRNDWGAALDISRGGLGIPGGIIAGVLVGVFLGYRRHIPVARGLDMVAPAFPVAQAIGRWGNWFNQELFGGPTDLPWGLRIDPEHRPDAYADEATFHPTFLYESLWNLALAALLVWIDRRFRPAGGRLLAMYVLGYGVG